MCIIIFAYKTHPDYPLLLLANRDEEYSRPTAPVATWDNDAQIVAGKDLIHGGTWLGYNRFKQWIAITNYRTPLLRHEPTRSRGLLVTDYLAQQQTAESFCRSLTDAGKLYNHFNLLIGDQDDLFYFSSYKNQCQLLTPGIYCLSNAHLNTPWFKVERLTEQFSQHLKQPFAADHVWSLLLDKTIATDAQLPNTGVSLTTERSLSAIFIETPTYGTRASYLLTKNNQYNLQLTEKIYHP